MKAEKMRFRVEKAEKMILVEMKKRADDEGTDEKSECRRAVLEAARSILFPPSFVESDRDLKTQCFTELGLVWNQPLDTLGPVFSGFLDYYFELEISVALGFWLRHSLVWGSAFATSDLGVLGLFHLIRSGLGSRFSEMAAEILDLDLLWGRKDTLFPVFHVRAFFIKNDNHIGL
ncbi:hypothetical protein BDV93DRAFT_506732 [Ceratobasidium sp. AG-I]|nr:hypothetical protein BDV93DRAFT_506732 [Ceratobasidium sp. AG-I]